MFAKESWAPSWRFHLLTNGNMDAAFSKKKTTKHTHPGENIKIVPAVQNILRVWPPIRICKSSFHPLHHSTHMCLFAHLGCFVSRNSSSRSRNQAAVVLFLDHFVVSQRATRGVWLAGSTTDPRQVSCFCHLDGCSLLINYRQQSCFFFFLV